MALQENTAGIGAIGGRHYGFTIQIELQWKLLYLKANRGRAA